MVPVLSSVASLLTLATSTLFVPVDSLTGANTREQTLSGTYDYIIVGGGVSGLVVANRLSENAQSMSSPSSKVTQLIMVRNCSRSRVWI
jgi:hypothetical protein